MPPLPAQATEPPGGIYRPPGLPVVRHSKRAGGGYHPGSPLYEEQQHANGQPIARISGVVPDGALSALYFPGPSTAFLCIVCLSTQYFIVYTALVVARTFSARVVLGEPGKVVAALEGLARLVNFAPLLCVLFLVVRLRALQLTRGDPEKHGLPQHWVQYAMLICSIAVLGQLVMLLALAVASDGPCQVDSSGRPEVPPGSSRTMARVSSGVRCILLLCQYGGIVAICVGLCLMQAPPELHGQGQQLVSHAMWCTMGLTFLALAVYLALAVANEARPRSKAAAALHLATFTVNLAPMASILFIAARLRALQVDPMERSLQGPAQWAFYVGSLSILVQTLRALAVPLALGGQASMGPGDGEVQLEVESPGMTTALVAIRWLAMLGLYGSFVVVIVVILLVQGPGGAQFTPKISPTMQCVINLNIQFFATYLVQLVVCAVSKSGQRRAGLLAETAFEDSSMRGRAVVAVQAACVSVMFCPMLCVVFIGARLRAMQLTRGLGAPQGWSQDCMYVSSYCVLAQLPVALGLGWATEKVEANPGAGGKRSTIVAAFEVVEFALIALMHAAALAVIVAVFTMTPETATGSGTLIVPPESAKLKGF